MTARRSSAVTVKEAKQIVGDWKDARRAQRKARGVDLYRNIAKVVLSKMLTPPRRDYAYKELEVIIELAGYTYPTLCPTMTSLFQQGVAAVLPINPRMRITP